MTFQEAEKIKPYVDKVVVKKTGEQLIVRRKWVHYPNKENSGEFVILKCNDSVLYNHTEVELA